jgi:hypothetical protein
VQDERRADAPLSQLQLDVASHINDKYPAPPITTVVAALPANRVLVGQAVPWAAIELPISLLRLYARAVPSRRQPISRHGHVPSPTALHRPDAAGDRPADDAHGRAQDSCQHHRSALAAKG